MRRYYVDLEAYVRVYKIIKSVLELVEKKHPVPKPKYRVPMVSS